MPAFLEYGEQEALSASEIVKRLPKFSYFPVRVTAPRGLKGEKEKTSPGAAWENPRFYADVKSETERRFSGASKQQERRGDTTLFLLFPGFEPRA